MRSFFPWALIPLLVACGGSTSSRTGEDDRVPATPLPSEDATAADRGPTGFVTLLTIDGELNVPTLAFFEDAKRTRDWSGTPCALTTGSSERPREVSGGAVTFTIPTRTGPETLDVGFDRDAGEYVFETFEGTIEPGGTLRVSANRPRVRRRGEDGGERRVRRARGARARSGRAAGPHDAVEHRR